MGDTSWTVFALFSYLAQMAFDADSTLERFPLGNAADDAFRGRVSESHTESVSRGPRGMEFALKSDASWPF
jgi:hypothetical protein